MPLRSGSAFLEDGSSSSLQKVLQPNTVLSVKDMQPITEARQRGSGIRK
jgi:hypothetical protein